MRRTASRGGRGSSPAGRGSARRGTGRRSRAAGPGRAPAPRPRRPPVPRGRRRRPAGRGAGCATPARRPARRARPRRPRPTASTSTRWRAGWRGTRPRSTAGAAGPGPREVGVEVQQVPRLVAQPAAGPADARAGDEQQQEGAGEGEQHPGVVDEQVPGLGEDGDLRLHRVADDDQHDVGEHEVHRPEADEAVPARELVLPVAALDERQPGHEQHLDQQQVRRDEPGDAPEGRHARPAAGEQVLHAPAAHPEGDDDEHARPGQGADGVAPPARHPVRAGPRDGVRRPGRRRRARRGVGGHGHARSPALGAAAATTGSPRSGRRL